MVSVALSAKAKNYDFSVADIKLAGLLDGDPSISIERGQLTISQNNRNYVVLEGEFKFGFGKSLDEMIKSLDAITVVEDGRQVYRAGNLDLTAADIGQDFAAKQWLAAQNYTVKGNATANEILGADGRDLVRGMAGNDDIFGLGGNDKLLGDAGGDLLNGGAGNDFLMGGLGIDTFVFASGDGADTILDFNAKGRAHDIIDLSAVDSVGAFEDLSLDQIGKNVVLDLGDGDMVTLKNVSLAHLDASDFLF